MTILDEESLNVITEVKIPNRDTDAILYEPVSRRVFSFNGADGHDATAIDAQTGQILGNIPLGGKPETGQTDGKGRVFVNVEDKNQIVEIDPKTFKVLNTWSTSPCKDPAGLAIDPAHQRLFAGCHNGMTAVVDYTSGKVVATIPIGQGLDANQFDPGTGLVFASCGDGTITVAHQDTADKYSVVQTIATQAGARTMALDSKSQYLYRDRRSITGSAPYTGKPAPEGADRSQYIRAFDFQPARISNAVDLGIAPANDTTPGGARNWFDALYSGSRIDLSDDGRHPSRVVLVVHGRSIAPTAWAAFAI